MIEVVRSGLVDASPERVWHVVSRGDRVVEWLAFADRVEVVGGGGCGERRTVFGRWRGRVSEVDQEVVEYRRPAVVAWRHVGERWDGKDAPRLAARTEFRVELEASGDGTLVRLRSLQEPASAGKGLLIKLFGARAVARGMERSLRALGALF
ncbi:SRPBCC family protein [Actinosynnema sp. NPDC020468]|uniref:SRPBCC family protein n=1 Tax=Actinosynnema sp. NPDC020468 TaxID=3154488 RepID=UPI0033E7954D